MLCELARQHPHIDSAVKGMCLRGFVPPRRRPPREPLGLCRIYRSTCTLRRVCSSLLLSPLCSSGPSVHRSSVSLKPLPLSLNPRPLRNVSLSRHPMTGGVEVLPLPCRQSFVVHSALCYFSQ
ncbi:hypothetical protein C8F01DRAFT_1378239 [Mycena amicta]|nr:hypothetical protein C8F01DRAFT_1378239 [Mycena amicta]